MSRPKLKAPVWDEQSFEDVGVPAQMRPPDAPGL